MKFSLKKLSAQFMSFLILNLSFIPLCLADEPSPIGEWKTYDLNGTERSIVRMSMNNGTLVGAIVKVIAPAKGQPLNPNCTNCQGQHQNKPLKDLVIIWGLKNNGTAWEEGHILDTDKGKIYKCNISISPDNRTLHLLAFVGTPMLGKTIDWIREN